MQLAAAPPAASPLRFTADLLCVIVGDESGSRLYWDLVDPGHAEAADLAYNDYEGSGAWAAYVSCRPEQTADNLRRVRGIYEAVNRDGVTSGELEQAKNKVASRVVLHSERPMGRLASLGGNWIYRREYRTVADDLAMLRAIAVEDIHALLAEYPLAQTTTVGVGPLDHVEW
jgi:predicted Zn-dependent peptidase